MKGTLDIPILWFESPFSAKEILNRLLPVLKFKVTCRILSDKISKIDAKQCGRIHKKLAQAKSLD